MKYGVFVKTHLSVGRIKKLTAENNGSFAPYGIPLYVCKSCYNKLKESEKDSQKE